MKKTSFTTPALVKFFIRLPFSLVLAGLLLTSVQTFGQTPQLINFQAVARTTAGDPIPSTTVQVQFQIRKNDPNNGVIEYNSDVHNYSTDACGMFTAKIGEFNSNTFSQINWANGTKYLEVKVNGLVIGTQQMLSVPYALQAGKVAPNSVGSGEIANGSIQAADLASGVIPAAPEIYIFEERYPHNTKPTTWSNTTDGTPLSNAFNTRKINTSVYTTPNASNVTLSPSTGQITFKPGVYLIQASAPAFVVSRHKLFLRDVLNNSFLLTGTDEFSNVTTNGHSRSFITGVLVVAGADKIAKLDHWLATTDVNAGGVELGPNNDAGPSSTWNSISEVYTTILIQKVQ